MPWYFPWSDSIKKRACRYLLQRYLGHFLKEKLSLDQLSLDLYNGKGTIKELLLDVVSLNEALDSYNVPFEIVDGFIGSISVDIPWSALVNDNTSVEINNLELTVQPKQRNDRPGVMLESMFASMTSSLELAQECLRQEPTEGEQHAESAQPFQGLEMFAMTIEAVLSRIKMTFADTVIRLEHLPKEAEMGAALELRVARLEYFDDIATDPSTAPDQSKEASGNQRVFETPAFAHKNIHLMGVSLYSDEFPAVHRTTPRAPATQQTAEDKISSSVSPPLYQPILDLRLDAPPDLKVTDPVKVAVLMGKQELKVKVKQNDELPGPKMEVDFLLGVVNFHLSPSQVHLLLKIADGLSQPADQNTAHHARRPRATSRPMEAEDEERVEAELQKRLQTSRLTRVSPYGHGPITDLSEPFATQSLEDSDEEMYFDLDGQSVCCSMTSSQTSTGTARSTSTTNSSCLNYLDGQARRDAPFQTAIPRSGRSRTKTRHKESLHRLLDDTASELARYKLRVSFLSVMLLHEDPPATPSDALDQGQTSIEKLRLMADKYFSRVQGINTSGIGTTLPALRDEFSTACPVDHISIFGKPLSLECCQKSSPSALTTSAEISVGHAEVVEAVFDRRTGNASLLGIQLPTDGDRPDYCQLLVFPQDDTPKTHPMFSSMHTASETCIRVKVHTGERVHQSPRRHSMSSAHSEVSVELARCRCELDISLVDRIHALLTPQPTTKPAHSVYVSAYKSFNVPSQSQHAMFNQTLDEGSAGSGQPTDIRVSAPQCTVIVSFPIPDLRRGTGIDRPWWRRCLRSERLLLDLVDADFQTSVVSGESVSKVEFTCREATASFQESPLHESVPFIYLTKADSCVTDREQGFDWPRLELKLFPKVLSQLEEVTEEAEDSNGADSLNGACQFEAAQPSPFSSKKSLYDNDELILPGDRQESALFQDKCISRTEMYLDLNLPNVNISFPSKEFFELVYNRLLNDLVLWEPLAPSPLDVMETYAQPHQGPGQSLDAVSPFMQQPNSLQTFTMCKSALQYESSSDSEDVSSEFYSTSDFRSRQRQKQTQDKGRKSKVCLGLSIGRGRLSARTHAKSEDGQTMDGCHGELCLDIADGCFFTVVQTDGDPEMQHMCIHAHQAALHHKGDIPDSVELPPLTRAPTSLLPPDHLHATMYRSDRGVETRLSSASGTGDLRDMLSLAVKIRINLLTNVEECLVTFGVKEVTLLHKMTSSNQSWFDQLVDFFDVKEYPILGYVKPQIVTQFHAHLWSCAIDYRPLYLPYRMVVTLETFSISSNVVAESQTSKLRFLIEDGALYIAQNRKCRHSKGVELRKDYVCVADLGLFELILTSSDGKDPKYPKLDLRASNNILHIRTCSDTCKALADLINYVADNGDAVLSPDGASQAGSATLDHSGSCSTLSDSPQLSQSHLDQVHDMMADAMRESSSQGSSIQSSPDKDLRDATEVFFFPGENGGGVHTPLRHPEGPSPSNLPDHPSPIPEFPSEMPDPYSTDSDEDSIERSLSQLRKVEVPGHDPTSRGGLVADWNEAGSQDPVWDGTQSHVTDTMESSGEFPVDEWDQGTEAVKGPDDDFCILDDPGLGITSRDGGPRIRVFTEHPIQIVDNHFEKPLGRRDELKAPPHFPPPTHKYTLSEMSLVWYMYGGRDFTPSSHGKAHLNAGGNVKSSPRQRGKPVGKLAWQARGGEERDMDICMELQLTKVRLQHEVYPETSPQASRQILLIHELEIRDRLLSSKINKFLYQYSSGELPRQSHANMVLVKSVYQRPDPCLPTLECSLRVSLQPLRLNIDQDSLFFLRQFFSDLSRSPRDSALDPPHNDTPPIPVATPKKAAPPPVMAVGSPATTADEEATAQDLVKFDEMLEAALGDEEGSEEEEDSEDGGVRETPTFFKSFVFSPDVPIRLDYHGKRVDMEQGTLAGLLVGLAHLNCSELRLSRLHHRHGLLGFDRLLTFALNEWLRDIKRNQLPSILGGVGPLHSLVQLVQGLRDLFWLPVEQYRKDGRIMRGLQRGAHSFFTCTAMSALELTNRVVQTVQYFAEIAYDMVSPGPSVRKKKYRKKMKKLTHPSDLREGVSNAYNVVTEGFKSTAETIYHTAVEEHEQKGVTGAVGGVLRQIPPTVLQPVILATEATANVLGGMRNQLLPDRKREDQEKWKPDEED